ncbi:hypothetical protein EDB92DRAFT_2108840 [Lactarius akahatsu]|uniref:DUF6533 domain-containing protein n=1 Tax=Lactarius akahatsu TaxID=416441 RepID=A0AAD4L2G1_9AGAM|nr:hypothetical protein EDB92DRAFT_2108840 [Lactarius akahatsu]
MVQQSLTPQLLASALNSVTIGRYTLTATYIVCFYDWIISCVKTQRFIRPGMLILTSVLRFDQEVALIYPAAWNVVKATYIFCRYYPMAIAPFHLWGLLGNHEQRLCESYYHVLFACPMPTLLSAQFILMLRTYAFSGRKTRVLVVLSITYSGLVGVIIWVLSKELTLSPLFFLTKRSGCFAISDEPNITVLVTSVVQGNKIPVPIAYHVGMISILATFFDCLNMLVVLWHWVRGCGAIGPLCRSFLKQGMLVYVVMIALNTLAICAYLSSYLVHEGFASSSALACILPSTLSCRLYVSRSLQIPCWFRCSFFRVLMLRQKASPTETELRLEHSHMINEALEMTTVERHPTKILEGFMSPISTDTEAQP